MNGAIAYAQRYARTPNYGSYKYFDGADCTNFVSQILEAGGESQGIFWWHKNQAGNHTHSRSWINANVFITHRRLRYTTTNHYEFSRQIRQGSIIAFDEGSDRQWEHVAFVVEADDYKANYHGKVYFDYKVAQHTNNYLEWASAPHVGWDSLEDKGYTYGIVR